MTATIEIPKLTPLQLGEMFWDMDADEQAQFFGAIGACALSEEQGYWKLDLQICYASQSPDLTPNGARVMEIIGAFAQGKRLQPIT